MSPIFIISEPNSDLLEMDLLVLLRGVRQIIFLNAFVCFHVICLPGILPGPTLFLVASEAGLNLQVLSLYVPCALERDFLSTFCSFIETGLLKLPFHTKLDPFPIRQMPL